MCLLIFAHQCDPRYPLVVAANRDEFHARPTAASAFWPEHPDLLAGRDLEQGGTWMGIGEGATVERAIVDKNCRIGAGANVSYKAADEADLEYECCVRDGVLVVPKNTAIPPGWSPK